MTDEEYNALHAERLDLLARLLDGKHRRGDEARLAEVRRLLEEHESNRLGNVKRQMLAAWAANTKKARATMSDEETQTQALLRLVALRRAADVSDDDYALLLLVYAQAQRKVNR